MHCFSVHVMHVIVKGLLLMVNKIIEKYVTKENQGGRGSHVSIYHFNTISPQRLSTGSAHHRSMFKQCHI